MRRSGPNLDSLPDLVARAWETGRQIDLSSIGYGKVHWESEIDVRTEPFNYYFFLAGLVRVLSTG